MCNMKALSLVQKLLPRLSLLWTDRRTDRHGYPYIPPNFVCGGYKKMKIYSLKIQHDVFVKPQGATMSIQDTKSHFLYFDPVPLKVHII